MSQGRDGRIDDLVAVLAAIPERVSDLVSALDEPALDYRHAPAFPTVREATSHLCRAGAAVEGLLRPACLDGRGDLRVRATLDPPDDAAAPVLLDELLETFARTRRRTVDLLLGLPDADWSRAVVDPDQGQLTLREVCAEIAQHEAGHLTQIRNLVALIPAR
jgi:hypothetical protein